MSHADVSPSLAPALPAIQWRKNLVLFLLTLLAVFITGIAEYHAEAENIGVEHPLSFFTASGETYFKAFQFVASVMTILVAHELGHYVMARIHKVDASLPFFIPMPILSPFGTMGAVIRMRGVIPTRRALLDIGASGPLAGMCFALPLYIWGVMHSSIIPLPEGGNGVDLGESILVKLIDHFAVPNVPDGMTIMFSPIAFGAWGGMFVTMINLLPVGQLDGGHVAYALFGRRQDRFAITVHRAMLAFFGVIVAGHLMRDVSAHRELTVALVSQHIANALFWLVWFNVLGVLGTLSRPRPDDDEEKGEPRGLGLRTRIFATLGLVVLASLGREHPSALLLAAFLGGFGFLIAMELKGGVLRQHDLLVHPPTAPEPMGFGRNAVAIFTLLLFALLFMPEPFSL